MKPSCVIAMTLNCHGSVCLQDMVAQHSVLYLSLTNTLTLASYWTLFHMSFSLAASSVFIFPGCYWEMSLLEQTPSSGSGGRLITCLSTPQPFLSQIVYPFFKIY